MLRNNLLVSAIFAIRLLDEESKTAVLNYAAQNNLSEERALSELILKGLTSTQIKVNTSTIIASDTVLEEVCC